MIRGYGAMELVWIDATGPFLRGIRRRRINWSKIPFSDLDCDGPAAEEFWAGVRNDMRRFAAQAVKLGCNAVTLDDVAHLVPDPHHGEELNRRIEFLRGEFVELFRILAEAGLEILVTSDVMPGNSPAFPA
jgi:hypothetical protein